MGAVPCEGPHGPMAVDLTANREILIADTRNNRVRMIDRSGVPTTVAGTGGTGSSGDGGPATRAAIGRPVDVAALAGGGFLIATVDGRVREVAPDGTIRTLYTDASAGPSTVVALPDGAVLIAQSRARRVLRVTRDVGVETLAGGGFCGVPG